MQEITNIQLSLSDEQFSELSSLFYNAAIDESGYAHLLEYWQENILSGSANPDASVHQVYRNFILEGLTRGSNEPIRLPLDGQNGKGEDPAGSRLNGFETTVAFTLTARGDLVRANAGAREIPGFVPPVQFANLPFEAADLRRLRRQLSASLTSGSTAPFFFSAPMKDRTETSVLSITPLQQATPDGESFLVVSSELVIPDGLDLKIAEAFGLSTIEAEIVCSLAEGASLKDIATRRGRSTETIRTQLRSIFSKTGTESQQDLIRVVLNFIRMFERSVPFAKPQDQPPSVSLGPCVEGSITRPDGRRVDYRILGDPKGSRTILYMPSGYGLTRWPATAEKRLADLGIRVIVPVRPGYGHSSEHPHRSTLLETVSDDMAALLDHLGVASCPCIALVGDGLFGAHMISRHPGRLSALIGCGGGLPLWNRVQIQRLDRWNRVLLTNARHAPFILPLLIRACFVLARHVGIEGFVRLANTSSSGDLAAAADLEIVEAGHAGTDIVLSEHHMAYKAYADELILQLQDWRPLLRGIPVPVEYFIGDQDPLFPHITLNEIQAEFPQITIRILAESGEFAFMKHWRQVLDAALKYMG